MFTFFLIEKKDYNTINTLIEQSATVIKRDKIVLSRDSFDAFFNECFSCMNMIQIESPDKHVVLKDLMRMVGLLDMNKNNLSLQSSQTENVVKKILFFIIDSLNGIIGSVPPDEWPLFKNGLSIIICIQLFVEALPHMRKLAKNSFTMEFLKHISNQNQIEDVADNILKHVENWNRTILDCHWSELLTLVNPRSIQPKHFEFNHSFQTYFSYIARFFPALALDVNYRHNISRHFDGLMMNDRFPSMFKLTNFT